MFFKTILVVLAFAVLGNGKPLENSTHSMTKFFSPRIVGGVDAEEGYAPHMAALVIGQEVMMQVCGASIVSRSLLLTAAHCVDMFVIWGQLLTTFHGVVGTNRWNTVENAVYFKDFYIHPEWDWDTLKNDISFLVMDKELEFSSTISPIELNFERIEDDQPSYVTGWGLLGSWPVDIIPYQLQILNVTTISHESCVQGLQDVADSLNGTVSEVDPKLEICTFHSVGFGLCHGDSGSALVSRKTYKQIGIVAWGIPCALAPDVYVRISGFKHYCNDIMSRHN